MNTTFRCVLADPPWKYGDKLRMSDTKRSAEDVYRTVMPTDDICTLAEHYAYGANLGPDVAARPEWVGYANLQIMKQRIADSALLFMWVTDPFLLNGDGARVVKAWGFEPKQLYTWVKGDLREDVIVGPPGLGHYFRVDTEHMIVGARGRAASMIMRHDLRNYIFLHPKSGHSSKPSLHAMIETLVPGPYLELFARERVDGWDAVGDELRRDTMEVL